MKKFLSAVLAAVMVICTGISALAATPAEDAELQFNKDGSFKILNLSDIQDTAKLLDITADFITAAVEAEQPDLIILTGDNIAGNSIPEKKTEKAIRSVMDVLDPLGVPVAMIYAAYLIAKRDKKTASKIIAQNKKVEAKVNFTPWGFLKSNII